MGNQLSNESGTKGPTRTFGRTGALGLSKSELDRRCTPSGLYPSCHWDDKAIRRLIGDGRLAARCKGNEVRKSMADQECPICFLHYPQTNVVQCCKANICTECFLQVRPQKEKHSVCPFCNNPKMFVSIAKRLDSGEIQERETKEQRMIEATIRARGVPEDQQPVSASEGFGSSLEQNDAVRRARSRTMSEDGGAGAGGGIDDSATSDIRLLRQLSLSSEDRTNIEREMRAQHTHPLALQMDAEAEERRIANEREYYRNNPQRTREASMSRAARMGGSNGSLRNRLTRINSVGRSRRFNDDSLDDMIVLEAAILLSMEEDGRNASASGDGSAAAAAAASNNPNPMMQQMLNGGGDSNDAAMSRGSSRRFRPGMGRTSSLSAIPSGSSSRFGGSLSEDEQVAMAIALSMQEQTEKSSDGEEESSKQPASLKADTPPESAPPMRAISAPSTSAGVASLPIVSEDDDDDNNNMDVMNEEILVMERKEFKGKASDDDSAYFRSVEQAEPEAKLPAGQPVSRLKEG